MQLQKLSQSDFDILKALENVVDAIAAMYGEHTEVLLHSLDISNPSVIKIVNGHVTDREVGAPVTNLALEKLKDGQDISDSYLTKTSSGKTLRSVTTIIRNAQSQAIGLLCINIDMDAPLQSVLKSMMPNCVLEVPIAQSPEVFARNLDETLHSAIDRVKDEVRADSSITVSQKSREIMHRLYDLGIFELKDSAQTAASRLNISVHTIYRYLREIKSNQKAS